MGSRTEVQIKATLNIGINTTKNFCNCFWLFWGPKVKGSSPSGLLYSLRHVPSPKVIKEIGMWQIQVLQIKWESLSQVVASQKGGQVKDKKEELHTGFQLKYKVEKGPLIQIPSVSLFIFHMSQNQSLLWKQGTFQMFFDYKINSLKIEHLGNFQIYIGI